MIYPWDRIIKPSQAREILGLGKDMPLPVDLPVIRIRGRHDRYRHSSVLRWMEEHEVEVQLGTVSDMTQEQQKIQYRRIKDVMQKAIRESLQKRATVEDIR